MATVWVQHLRGDDDFGVWAVVQAGHGNPLDADTQRWASAAAAIFAQQPDVASISIVADGTVAHERAIHTAVRADSAVLPVCFFNGRVADLIGLETTHDQQDHQVARFEHWVAMATRKGLTHLLLVRGGTRAAADAAARSPITVGIDAAGLLDGVSGAQVYVFEMVREMVKRPEIARVVFLSDTGAIPRYLAGTPKVSGGTWSAVLSGGIAKLDILHRPSQPDASVDFARYHRAARCVALTVLDFIAYDNPSYHESSSSWREHRRAFDHRVQLADRVFTISRYVGQRLERQFAHRLAGPVLPVYPGTDHLSAPSEIWAPASGHAIAELAATKFILVLGNDFAHKNRDFAVRVFQDMRRRGYQGRLVLAGFHLDIGSSFERELEGDADGLDSVTRIGAVTESEKVWLLKHAEVVLYPTSSEGFGFIPFEAAALGTPTAFVRFGPLKETLPEVRACSAWQVGTFADHVFSLIADPAPQVAEIQAAAAVLTWRRCAGQVIDAYFEMLDDSAPWQSVRQPIKAPGIIEQSQDYVNKYARRAARKARRALRI